MPSSSKPASATERTPSPPGPEPVVELQGVSRAFGRCCAVEGVTLAVRPGERVALLGPSGAGKSTLLRIVNTSLPATGGVVRVLGSDVAALSPRALRALRARI